MISRLLPILLVVMLSGCGGEVKATLEKCADNKTLATQSKNLKFMKSIGFDGRCSYSREVAECKAHLLEFLTTKPLSEKLSFGAYEYRFQLCEDDKSNYPETFDAKWK